MKIMVINGPNLNMVGIREKSIYGTKTFGEICDFIRHQGEEQGHELTLLQSNYEGAIIEFLHKAYMEKFDGVIINPGAYSHYSYAIFDAIKAIAPIPVIEVHLSDISKREDFRCISVTGEACIAKIYGHGETGYGMAMKELKNFSCKSSRV